MTSAKDVVARLMTLSGHTLLLVMEPMDPGEFFAENANGLSAAWITGHMACFADLFSSEFDIRRLLLSRDFHKVFNDTDVTEAGPVSKAASVSRELYPKALLLHRYNQVMVKALRALRAFDLAQWDVPAPPAVPVSLRTRGDVWERLAAHGYWHNGELSGSLPRYFGTYAFNIEPHHLHVPPGA